MATGAAAEVGEVDIARAHVQVGVADARHVASAQARMMFRWMLVRVHAYELSELEPPIPHPEEGPPAEQDADLDGCFVLLSMVASSPQASGRGEEYDRLSGPKKWSSYEKKTMRLLPECTPEACDGHWPAVRPCLSAFAGLSKHVRPEVALAP